MDPRIRRVLIDSFLEADFVLLTVVLVRHVWLPTVRHVLWTPVRTLERRRPAGGRAEAE